MRFQWKRSIARLQLMVPSFDGIEVEEAGAADPFSIPVQSISRLLRAAPGTSLVHRMRVRGVITEHPGGAAFVADDTGKLAIEMGFMISPPPDTPLDVVGFLARRDADIVLEDVVMRPVEEGRPTTRDSATPIAQPATLPVLSTIAAVRGLRRSKPARLSVPPRSRDGLINSAAIFITTHPAASSSQYFREPHSQQANSSKSPDRPARATSHRSSPGRGFEPSAAASCPTHCVRRSASCSAGITTASGSRRMGSSNPSAGREQTPTCRSCLGLRVSSQHLRLRQATAGFSD